MDKDDVIFSQLPEVLGILWVRKISTTRKNHLLTGTEESTAMRTKGTKLAAHYQLNVKSGESATVKCRIVFLPNATQKPIKVDLGKSFDDIFNQRIKEADGFYNKVVHAGLFHCN